MRQQAKATILALTTVLIWSTVASAFKLSLRLLTVQELLLYSSACSVVVLGLVIAAQGRLRQLAHISGRDVWLSAGLGFLNPFAYYCVLFQAYDLLPAQEAQPLNYTWAITLSLLSVPLLKQPLRLIDLCALAVSYSGVYVISTRGDLWSLEFSNPLGVGLALGSTIIWALYWILNTRDALDPACRLFLNFIFGTLFVGAALALTQGFSVPPLKGLLGALYVGALEMGITFVLWSMALKLSQSAAQVSIFIYLSPFLSLVFIHFLVGETILPSTFVGLILIVIGIGGQQAARLLRAG
ncbi:DMT family transporter [Desulfovermiculus halophilus]|jgi:drug/metabolite transporter (DMT)-like permease|uniref:DMT family transporter n=1 Tax=Desulfovermiculus halophilus TaxID=339722 RepID=UPI0004814F9A|nr:DMT family transporter [Desulfovermiculus halophilus]